MIEFVHKRHFKAIPSFREPYVPFCTLGKLFDAEDITNGKYSTLHLPLEFKIVTSKPENRNLSFETDVLNPQNGFTQTNDPNNKSKSQFWKNFKHCLKLNLSVSNCFPKNRGDIQTKRIFFSIKTACEVN